VQALVTRSVYSVPRRIVQGIDYNRFSIITAVLEKLLQMPLFNKDVFLNIPGGVNVKDPGIDLPVALAIISSTMEIPVPSDMFSFGEMGLTGEIRQVMWQEKRIEEAVRLGYREGVIPVMKRGGPRTLKEVRFLREVYEFIKRCQTLS